jgi:hypothetical protein
MRKAKMADKEALARRSSGFMGTEVVAELVADGFSGFSVTHSSPVRVFKKRGWIVLDWALKPPRLTVTGIIKGFADLTTHRETC